MYKNYFEVCEISDEERESLAFELRKVMKIVEIEECEPEEEESCDETEEVEGPSVNDGRLSVFHESDDETDDCSFIKTQVFVNSSFPENKNFRFFVAPSDVEELPKKSGLVLIRNLPPTMSEDEFYNEISPIPPYDFFFFVLAEQSSMPALSYSRAYINFVCPDNIHTFYEKFDRFSFYNSKGHEYIAKVELAPFLNILKKNSYQDQLNESYITYIGYMKIKKVKKSRKELRNKRIGEKMEKKSSNQPSAVTNPKHQNAKPVTNLTKTMGGKKPNHDETENFKIDQKKINSRYNKDFVGKGAEKKDPRRDTSKGYKKFNRHIKEKKEKIGLPIKKEKTNNRKNELDKPTTFSKPVENNKHVLKTPIGSVVNIKEKDLEKSQLKKFTSRTSPKTDYNSILVTSTPPKRPTESDNLKPNSKPVASYLAKAKAPTEEEKKEDDKNHQVVRPTRNKDRPSIEFYRPGVGKIKRSSSSQ